MLVLKEHKKFTRFVDRELVPGPQLNSTNFSAVPVLSDETPVIPGGLRPMFVL